MLECFSVVAAGMFICDFAQPLINLHNRKVVYKQKRLAAARTAFASATLFVIDRSNSAMSISKVDTPIKEYILYICQQEMWLTVEEIRFFEKVDNDDAWDQPQTLGALRYIALMSSVRAST